MMIGRASVAVDIDDETPFIPVRIDRDGGILRFFASRIAFLRVGGDFVREFAGGGGLLGGPGGRGGVALFVLAVGVFVLEILAKVQSRRGSGGDIGLRGGVELEDGGVVTIAAEELSVVGIRSGVLLSFVWIVLHLLPPGRSPGGSGVCRASAEPHGEVAAKVGRRVHEAVLGAEFGGAPERGEQRGGGGGRRGAVGSCSSVLSLIVGGVLLSLLRVHLSFLWSSDVRILFRCCSCCCGQHVMWTHRRTSGFGPQGGILFNGSRFYQTNRWYFLTL